VQYEWPLSSPVQHQGLANVSERAAECVDRVLDRALVGLELSGTRSLFVVFGHEAPSYPGHHAEKPFPFASVEHDRAAIERCYALTEELWPTLEGDHVVEMVVEDDGHVSVARTAGGTLENPALECCVNTAVKRWKYSKLPSGSAFRVISRLRFLRSPPAADP
jgi:hypothetical protein